MYRGQLDACVCVLHVLAIQDIAEREPTMHTYATRFCISTTEWTESGPTTESERNGFDILLAFPHELMMKLEVRVSKSHE